MEILVIESLGWDKLEASVKDYHGQNLKQIVQIDSYMHDTKDRWTTVESTVDYMPLGANVRILINHEYLKDSKEKAKVAKELRRLARELDNLFVDMVY